jgi:hypothetical protein
VAVSWFLSHPVPRQQQWRPWTKHTAGTSNSLGTICRNIRCRTEPVDIFDFMCCKIRYPREHLQWESRHYPSYRRGSEASEPVAVHSSPKQFTGHHSSSQLTKAVHSTSQQFTAHHRSSQLTTAIQSSPQQFTAHNSSSHFATAVHSSP